jgi:hypothetical protein
VTPGNPNHVEALDFDELSPYFDRSYSGSSGHAMPALFKDVGNTHPLILTVRDLRWHLWRIFGLDAAWLSLVATVFSDASSFDSSPNVAPTWLRPPMMNMTSQSQVPLMQCLQRIHQATSFTWQLV